MLNSKQLTELQDLVERPVRFTVTEDHVRMSFTLTEDEKSLLQEIETVLWRNEYDAISEMSDTCPIAKGLTLLSNHGTFDFDGMCGKVWALPNNLPTSENVSSLMDGAILCSSRMRSPFMMAQAKALVMAAILDRLLLLK